MLLEVCVDSLASAETALRGGADRLELCGNLGLGGGTSPSLSLVKLICAKWPDAKLMVMVRPRAGDFVYQGGEVEVMLEEVAALKEAGVYGVVLGCLTGKGDVDVAMTKRLVEAASPLEVTFHRAFDMIPSLEQAKLALVQLASIPGISRILTSSLSPSFPPALPTYLALLSCIPPGSSLTLLPGSGLSPASLVAPIAGAPGSSTTLLESLRSAGVKELHASCSGFVPGPTAKSARREGMGMGLGGDGEWGRWTVDEDKVRDMKRLMMG